MVETEERGGVVETEERGGVVVTEGKRWWWQRGKGSGGDRGKGVVVEVVTDETAVVVVTEVVEVE